MSNPWDREAAENDKPWEAFQIYLALPLGARTVAETSRKLNKSHPTVAKWHDRWRWKERSHAWEMEKDRQAKEAELKAIQEMRTRHVNISKGLTALAGMDLEHWIGRMNDHRKSATSRGEKPEPLLNPRDIRALVDAGIKLERLSRGEPDSIQEHQDATVSEKRQAMRQLLAHPEAREAIHVLTKIAGEDADIFDAHEDTETEE